MTSGSIATEGATRSDNPFASVGGDYARHRPDYPSELADALADACSDHAHALDVGCGSGQLSVRLATRFDHVTATDPAPGQIQSAVAHERVSYAVEPAERIGLPDASVDLVVAAQAAHWFDLPAFYAEVRRVGCPGATLALVSYGVPELDGEASDRFATLYAEHALRAFWPAGRQHVENGYRSLDFPFAERTLPSLAILRDWTMEDMLGYIGTWSSVSAAKRAGAAAIVDDFEQRVRRLWGSGSRRVRWPIIGRLGTIA